MNFKEAISTCFSKYATFSGRARRSEFWYFELFYIIATSVTGVWFVSRDGGTSLFGSLISFALFIPWLAVTVRRLHDVGKSGWYMFISLIPIVGWILLIVQLAKDGQPFANDYGASPKYGEPAQAQAAAPSSAAEPATKTAVSKEDPDILQDMLGTYTTSVTVEGQPDVTLEAEHTLYSPAPESAEAHLKVETFSADAAKYCPGCGNLMPDDAKFCTLCGTKLNV